MKCSESTEYRVALGKVISMAINKGIQEGLDAGFEHGKAGRSLAAVEAYDAEVEAKYVVVVHDLENAVYPVGGRFVGLEVGSIRRIQEIGYGVLEFLGAWIRRIFLDGYGVLTLFDVITLKDYPLELLMSSLTLERSNSEDDLTLKFRKLQPVSNQVIVSVYYERGGSKDLGSISYEILLLDALAASRARCEKQKKAHLEIDHQVSSAANVGDTVPSSESDDDLFDAIVFDKPVDS
ncbi:hypothetical protein Tco_1067192 [Tanacetum coccineum]|uniref:Essential protein Yae1 N-terminal domain-containing protein n=1 Tax=Tanacetum coccineum TaxID=301880 RepID=A0ABQ5HC51_9ASTR